MPYFFYLNWKISLNKKISPFAIFISFTWFTFGILSLGVVAGRGEKLTFGFFVLSFLGIVLFSFYIFSILKEIKELKQIKGK